MPALIDYRLCDDSPHCSAARYCPNGAWSRTPEGKWQIDAAKCRTCSGICSQVCPAGAVRFSPTMSGLEEIRAELDASDLTADDLFEQRYGFRPVDPRSEGLNIAHADCDDFEEKVLKSDLPVVVDFWAEWCQPCKVIAPTFKKLAEEYAGRVRFVKVDTEACREVPMRYRVMGIPTLMAFKNGKEAGRVVGAVPEERLRALADSVA